MKFLCLLIHYHISFSAFSSPAFKYFCSSYEFFVGCERFCIRVKPTLTVFALLFTSANMFFLFLCKTTGCVIVSVATAAVRLFPVYGFLFKSAGVRTGKVCRIAPALTSHHTTFAF